MPCATNTQLAPLFVLRSSLYVTGTPSTVVLAAQLTVIVADDAALPGTVMLVGTLGVDS